MENLNKVIKEKEAELAKLKEKKAKAEKKVNVAKGTIIATSTAEGLVWECNASSEQVVNHAVSTIKSAILSLKSEKGTKADLLTLALMIAKELAGLTDD